MNKNIYWRAGTLIFVCWIFYLFFSFPSWREPVMGDEVAAVMWIKGIRDSTIPEYFIKNGDRLFGSWHPPTYAHLAAFLGNFLALNELTIRIVGIASFLASLILVYLITYGLFKREEGREQMSALACLIYALNPLAVKGSLLIDIDGTVLNVAMLTFIAALIWYRYDEKSPRSFLIHTVLFAAALCVKLPTPLILIVSLLAYQLLRSENRKLLYTLKIAVSGASLALFIWLIYCLINKKDFFGIFEVPISVVRYFRFRIVRREDWLLIARHIWAPVIWSSPSFIIMGVIGLWKNFRKRREDNLLMSAPQFAFYGLAVSVIYIFVGGVTHSFPKYHYAFVPVFTVLVANIFIKNVKVDKRLLFTMSALIAALVLYNIYFVKDPLYLINYVLKEDIIIRKGALVSAIIKEEAVRIVLLLLTIPAVFIFYRRKRIAEAFILALFITMLASNIALLSIQRAADYNTVYCYGAKGVRETANFVLLNTGLSDTIIAPSEIILLSNRSLSSYLTAKYINSKEIFLDRLSKGDISCVIYGISGNTIKQYRNVFYDKDVRTFLNQNYLLHEIGSYSIWFKKEKI